MIFELIATDEFHTTRIRRQKHGNNGAPHVEAGVSLAAREARAKSHAPQDDQTPNRHAPANPIGGVFCLLPLQTSRCGKIGSRRSEDTKNERLRGFWQERKSARLVVKVGRLAEPRGAGNQPAAAATCSGQDAPMQAEAACRRSLQEPLISCAERVSQAGPGKQAQQHRRKEGATGTNMEMAGKRRHLATCSPALLARLDGHGLAYLGDLGIGAGRARGTSGKRRAWPHGGTPAGTPLPHCPTGWRVGDWSMRSAPCPLICDRQGKSRGPRALRTGPASAAHARAMPTTPKMHAAQLLGHNGLDG